MKYIVLCQVYILRGVTCHTMVILFLLVAPGVVTGVQGTYPYVVWSPPERPNGKITSYTLTFIRTQSSTARTVTTRSGDSFYVIQPSDLPWTSGSFAVTVSSTLCRFVYCHTPSLSLCSGQSKKCCWFRITLSYL